MTAEWSMKVYLDDKTTIEDILDWMHETSDEYYWSDIFYYAEDNIFNSNGESHEPEICCLSEEFPGCVFDLESETYGCGKGKQVWFNEECILSASSEIVHCPGDEGYDEDWCEYSEWDDLDVEEASSPEVYENEVVKKFLEDQFPAFDLKELVPEDYEWPESDEDDE